MRVTQGLCPCHLLSRVPPSSPPTLFTSPDSFKPAETAPPIRHLSRPLCTRLVHSRPGGTQELVVSWGPRRLCILTEGELQGRREEGAVGAQTRGSRPAWRVRTCLTTAKSEPGRGKGVSSEGHRGATAQKPEVRHVPGPVGWCVGHQREGSEAGIRDQVISWYSSDFGQDGDPRGQGLCPVHLCVWQCWAWAWVGAFSLTVSLWGEPQQDLHQHTCVCTCDVGKYVLGC